MASAILRAHLFPKLCTCTASVVSMPLCIKAASWQAVHHLVRTLAKLLQNGYLKQATSPALLRLLRFCNADMQLFAGEQHGNHTVCMISAGNINKQSGLYVWKEDRMEQPALCSQQNNHLWRNHCGDAVFYAQCAVSGLLTSAGASSFAGWKGNTAEK